MSKIIFKCIDPFVFKSCRTNSPPAFFEGGGELTHSGQIFPFISMLPSTLQQLLQSTGKIVMKWIYAFMHDVAKWPKILAKHTVLRSSNCKFCKSLFNHYSTLCMAGLTSQILYVCVGKDLFLRKWKVLHTGI